MTLQGYIRKNETYEACARIEFHVDKAGENVLDITNGILYLFSDSKLIRIASVFDIKFV